MDVLNRHFWKFLAGLLAFMVLGLSVAYGTHYYAEQDAASRVLQTEQLQK